MLYSYVKMAIRSIMKRKLFSAINIFGLAIGFAVCLILLTYVGFELSYDRHNEKANNIYRTVSTFYIKGELKGTYPLSDFGQGPALLENIPEINNVVRTHLMHGGAVISNNDNLSKRIQFYEDESIQFVDPTYFEIFTHDAIEGDLQTALDQPNSIVLTEAAAKKYFGTDHQIVGKVLNVSGSWWTNGDHVVTSVIKNVPSASHFTFDFLISTHSLLSGVYKSGNGKSTEGNFVTYIELNQNADINSIEEKLPAFEEKYQGQELKRIEGKASVFLQPLTDIHLTPGYNLDMSPTISITTLYFFIIVTILVILLAWINYINLSTARAMERRKEVGVKKTIGAHRYQLISQFMTESHIIHIVSGVFGICLAYLLLPLIGEMLDKDLFLDFTNSKIWLALLGFIAIGSFIAGAYPSFVLSSLKPLSMFKGAIDGYSHKFSLRHALVVFQFASSIIIMAATFVVARQLGFMQNQNKGFDSERILIVKGPGSITDVQIENSVIAFKAQLKNLSMITNVATSDAIPGGGYNWGTGMRKNGAAVEENKNGDVVNIDPDFIPTYNMNVLSGRLWDVARPGQRRSVLLNETASKTFGFENADEAISEKLIIGSDTFDINGVLKDYHWSSLKTSISPYIFATTNICGKYLSVEIQNSDLKESIAQIEKLFLAAFPDKPFEYFFLDNFFDRQYQQDQQFRHVVSLFALLSIVIASLGLWGLASVSIGQRIKEISIRKVLGASIQSIILLLTSGFFKLILIASVIALPVIIYGIDTWLSNFAYKINPSWDLYLLPIIALIVISITTISATTIKATLTNPADSLRGD